MVNPYSGADFFTFFKVLFFRVDSMMKGESLATDEVQILVLLCLSVSCALVGTFLVLRNMTMLANALSHTVLLGIVGTFLLFYGAFSLNELSTLHFFVASLIAATITALFTEFLTKVIKLQEDASIGLVFTFLFAVSIAIVTLFTKNQHIGLDFVMGNVDALKMKDLILVFEMLMINCTLCFVFFKELKVTTFDAGLSKALGFSPTLFNLLIIFLTALTSVSAFRAVGVLMVLAFFVLPPLIARLFTHSLKKLILTACTLSTTVAIAGVALSRHLLSYYGVALSTGAIVVTLLSLTYVGVLAFRTLTQLSLKQWMSSNEF